MTKINQKGIVHLVVVVAIVVVTAIGGIGYYVYQNQRKDKDSISNNSSSSADTNTSSKSAEEDSVKKTAKNHFLLLRNSQMEDAYKSTCRQFQEQTSFGDFKLQLDQTGLAKLDLSGIEYTNVQIANNQARISGAIGPLVPNTNLEVDLLKDSGNWCIYGYRTT